MAHGVVAILLAAGESRRMGSTGPKVLADLAGEPVLERAITAFEVAEAVKSIVVVSHADIFDRVSTLVGSFAKVDAVVAGGSTRTQSTLAGLEAIEAEFDGRVLVHDAARPLVQTATIEALVAQLATADAATIATPATDTMLSVTDGAVTDVPDRTQLWHAQTPQGFRIATLRAAYVAMGSELQDFSDDCGLVRRYLPETRIAVVSGAADNMKITELGDLELAAGLLARRVRIKNGPYNE